MIPDFRHYIATTITRYLANRRKRIGQRELARLVAQTKASYAIERYRRRRAAALRGWSRRRA